MSVNKVIKLDEYRNKKAEQKNNSVYCINKFKSSEKNDREDTFTLFMRVLSTIRQESY